MEHPAFQPERFATGPGVYLMKGEDGTILYVGKAKNLRARLRSYLRAEQDGRPQIRFLLARVRTVETIVTDTEKEALILENTLIKEHRPKYNIDLRDDKTYVSIRIDPRETFPALRVVRKVARDGALYFGPFASSTAVRETLKHLYRIFPLRHHAVESCARRSRPCLFYQIGQCSAPCHGKISASAYAELVKGAIALLSGQIDEVVRQLREEMRAASAALRFEEAAVLRDRIAAVAQTVERQKMVSHGGGDCDVFGCYGDGHEYEIVVLLVRKGRLLDRRNYRLASELGERTLLSMAVQQFYVENDDVPERILTPLELEDAEPLVEWLAERRGARVVLQAPQRGEKAALVELAGRNAAELWREQHATPDNAAVLQQIAQHFGLRRVPQRMECFDISHLQGQSTVGSMVVFVDGRPAKQFYRRFEVASGGQPDDYASLREVLTRRLERGVQEGDLPQLIVIDGGRGQLGVLEDAIRAHDLAETVEIASVAKARPEPVAGVRTLRSEERFFRPGASAPIILPPRSPALRILEQLRDEAHRFAISYHRQKRGKALLASQLEQIPGIGPKRRLALLRHFGSVRRLREASVAEIAAVPGLGQAVAAQIHQALHDAAP